MKRVMVNLDDKAGDLLEQKASAEKRSASSYIALLVEADLRAAGLLVADDESANAEFITKVHTAIAAQPELKDDIERIIARGGRDRRRKIA